MKKKKQIPKLSLKKMTITLLTDPDGQKTAAILGGNGSSGRIRCQNQCQLSTEPECGIFETRFVDCKSQIPERC